MNSVFTETKYGIKLVYDEKHTSQGKMCSSNIILTYYIFWVFHAKIFEENISIIPSL